MSAATLTQTAPETDDELVARALAGEQAAAAALYERYADGVRAVCARRLRGTAAEDAVQEAFLRAFSSLHQLREPSSFGAWVRGIAARVCIDEHRHRARFHVVADHEDRSCPDPLPDDLALRQERRRDLAASLATLSERDQEMLWMRDGLGYGVDDVAAQMGLTAGSARVMLTRARHRLRDAAAGMAAILPLPVRRWIAQLGDGLSWQATAVAAGVPALVAATLFALSTGPSPAPPPAPEPLAPPALESPREAPAPPDPRTEVTPPVDAVAPPPPDADAATRPHDDRAGLPDGVEAGPIDAGFRDEPVEQEPAAEFAVSSGDEGTTLYETGVYVGGVLDDVFSR